MFEGPFTRSDPTGGGGWYLYVVEIVDRGVKVGVTGNNPKIRIGQHQRDAEAYGCRIGRTWVSPRHGFAYRNEKRLIRLVGPKQTREYLPLDFDFVVAHARTFVGASGSTGRPVIDYFISQLTT